ncbi:MAG: gluconokinase [Ktedonobacterales bacterium]|nr:gluconokinase [Ktedonobacterales bacterium]
MQPQQSQAGYVLALDVGSSSTRALLFDAHGDAVPDVRVQHPYAVAAGPDATNAPDADEMVERTCVAIDDALRLAGTRAGQIRAVATDTFWHSLVAVDAMDRALTPVYTWADRRSVDAVAQLRGELDATALHARTGAPLHTSYWPAKLRWLRDAQPALFTGAAQFISLGEYLHRRLLGQSRCGLCMASGTGLLATAARAWDADLCAHLHVRPDQLPPLADVGDGVRGLRVEFAQRWPALAAVPWYPALGDGATANVGSGCLDASRVAISVGTSSALRVIQPVNADPLPAGVWRYLLDRDRAIVGGALSEGGNLAAWLRTTLGLADLTAAEALAAHLPPDGHGLTVLPFIAGERSPGWHADATLTVSGITSRTSTSDLLRAFMESLAYQIATVYADVRATLPADPAQMIGSGGGLTQSPLLQGILAATLGMPLALSAESEASARGSALLALVAEGVLPDLAILPPSLGSVIAPDVAATPIYRNAQARQNALAARLLI